jgi:hypothetical protein
MPYQRKTRDVYRVQGNYGFGHGWETECEESSYREARARLREYQENGSGSYRIRCGREPIEGVA